MAHGLSTRISRIEKRLEAEAERLPMPIPGQPGRTVMLPRRFVEWMTGTNERVLADGGWFNCTDGRWVDCRRLNDLDTATRMTG
jgi:hypothetical protein